MRCVGRRRLCRRQGLPDADPLWVAGIVIRRYPSGVVAGQLPGLVERFGIPDPAWDGDYQAWCTWPAEAYIEVQLWSDEPIAEYLRPSQQTAARRNRK